MAKAAISEQAFTVTYQFEIEEPQDVQADESKNDEAHKGAVVHPKHYNMGKYEVIEVVHDWKLGFNLGNAVKYIARAKHKNPDKEIEDLEKAVFYLLDEIKRLESANSKGE